jgi:hypothetical protein
MTANEYLAKVLSSQTLGSNSSELKDLQDRRAEVEDLLRTHFDDGTPTIRYGGSKAKGTMIKESYDLDIVCYFGHNDTSAGESLEDIYNNVRKALETKYMVESKSSALRLRDASTDKHCADFHIDVVPGRFTDDQKADTFLFISTGEKKRLKTNLDVHVAHVKESGVVDAIRLMKLWKVRNNLSVRNFVLELAVIGLLSSKKDASLATQLKHVWTALRDNIDGITIEDPANPAGNDLSELWKACKSELSDAAKRTLEDIESSDWEAVYGPIEEDRKQNFATIRRAAADDRHDDIAALRRAVIVAAPTRAWCRDA